jgi:hypothetical protein
LREDEIVRASWEKRLRLAGSVIGPVAIAMGAAEIADGQFGFGVYLLAVGVVSTLQSVAPRFFVPKFDPERPPSRLVLGAALGFVAASLFLMIVLDRLL